jgi:hypothetical protein
MHDLTRKRALYANAGSPSSGSSIPALRSVVVLTEPSAGDYRTERVYHEGEVVRS